MSGVTFAARLVTRRLNFGWTCARCRDLARRPDLSSFPASRQFGTSRAGSTKFNVPPNRRRVVILAAAGTGVATTILASVLAFTDEVKHSYEGAERTGRVASALAICINE